MRLKATGSLPGLVVDDERAKFHESVWAVVANIPRGRVASYKQVAELAGFPRSARFVSRALRFTRVTNLPWHRVIGHDGSVRIQDPGLRLEQIQRLRSEGVDVSPAGVVPMERFRWRASSSRSAAR